MFLRICIFFSIFLLLGSVNLFAELFKCISKDGTEYYSNTVCPVDAEKEVIIKKKKQTKPEVPQDSTTSEPYIEINEQQSEEGLVYLDLITHKYKASKSDIGFLNVGVKFLHQYYAQVFNFNDDINVKIRIFGKYDDYITYTDSINGFRSNAGFYSRKLEEGVINGARNKSAVLATTLHEASHAILDKKVPYLPLWVNEGLAEYFERMVPDGKRMVIRQQNSRHIQLLMWLSRGELLSMKRYLKLNNKSWQQKSIENDQITRTMAWSIVHFLMSTEKGQKSLVKILQAFGSGDSRDPIKIVNSSYGGGVRLLEKQWLKYIKSPPTIHTYDIY